MTLTRSIRAALFSFTLCGTSAAQTTIPFTSGDIPLCDTSIFTADVVGIGSLAPPGTQWFNSLMGVTINITTNHPQTLQIILTSPEGTEVVLSSFNGAGGVNYTNSTFLYWGGGNITTGSAPFTGSWTPQLGSLSDFDWENADGTWLITVIDTSCANGGAGPNGNWTGGWFNGGGAGQNGGFYIDFNMPQCLGWMFDDAITLCAGQSVDILNWYAQLYPYYMISILDSWGGQVPDPTNVTAEGYYNVQGIDPWDGCFYGATFVVTTVGDDLGPDQTVNICLGSPAVDLTALFGGNTNNQAWYLGGSQIAASQASNTITPGVYQLIENNGPGCADTAFVTLNISNTISLGPDQAIQVCPGSNTPVDLTALFPLNGGTPAWSLNGSPITLAVAQAAGSNGTYQLINTYPGGCGDTVLVQITTVQGVGLGPDQTIAQCPGAGPIDLTGLYGLNGASPSWSFGGSPIPISTAEAAIDGGVYQLIISYPDGCGDTAMVTLNNSGGPLLGPDQIVDQCTSAGPVDLTAIFTLNGTTPIWTLDGASIPISQAEQADISGDYQLIADAGGTCNDTAIVTLNFIPGPALGPDQTAGICPGGTFDLSTAFITAGLTTNWFFAGSPVPNPSSVDVDGDYTLIATAATCSDSAVVSLSIQPIPTLGPDQTMEVCSNETVDLSTLFDTPGVVQSWTFAGVPVSSMNVNTAGTYQIMITGGAGCTDSALIVLNVLPTSMLGPDSTTAICSGAAVDLSAFYLGAGASMEWYFGGAAVADPTSISTAGTYMAITTNASGCSDSAAVIVIMATAPILGPDQTVNECGGVPVDLTTLYAISPNTAAWTESGAPVADPTYVLNSGLYTITAFSASGCTSTAIVTVSFDVAPALGPDATATICSGVAQDLTGFYSTAGLTSNWTFNGSSVPDPFSVSVQGDYRIVVVNVAGCSDTAVVALTIDPNPLLGGDQSFRLCPWQTVDLSAIFPTAGYSVIYSVDGTITDSTVVHNAGTYTVSVTNTNGCTDSASATITNIDCLCEAAFDSDALCLQDPVHFTLLADSAVVTTTWDFGGAANVAVGTDPSVLFVAEGDVIVTLQATLTCGVVTVIDTIHMDDCSDLCSLWIPNAFTPNNDKVNDVWKWVSDCEPDNFKALVFDRWGKLIFTTNDPTIGWDGSYSGTQSQIDVYVYRVEYQLPYQDHKEAVGSVTLAR